MSTDLSRGPKCGSSRSTELLAASHTPQLIGVWSLWILVGRDAKWGAMVGLSKIMLKIDVMRCSVRISTQFKGSVPGQRSKPQLKFETTSENLVNKKSRQRGNPKLIRPSPCGTALLLNYDFFACGNQTEKTIMLSVLTPFQSKMLLRQDSPPRSACSTTAVAPVRCKTNKGFRP